MTAPTLTAYYDQWRQLSLAEAEAIAAARWDRVDQLQETKRQLQGFIDGWLRTQSAARVRELTEQFRPLLRDLIELERRNAAALSDQLRRAEEQRAALETADRRLRQVRQAYAPPRDAAWQTYS
jgi:DNA repair exonuclease SbcCD ATPase subunit